MRHKINWISLVIIILITEIIGVAGSLFSGNASQRYESFLLPAFSPPSWIFGIIWPILYLLMGISVYIIYNILQTNQSKRAIYFYWVQLILNFTWPIMFFRFNAIIVSVFIILLLDIIVFITIVLFYKINKIAGYLLIPYIIWLLFATYLNIGIAFLN